MLLVPFGLGEVWEDRFGWDRHICLGGMVGQEKIPYCKKKRMAVDPAVALVQSLLAVLTHDPIGHSLHHCKSLSRACQLTKETREMCKVTENKAVVDKCKDKYQQFQQWYEAFTEEVHKHLSRFPRSNKFFIIEHDLTLSEKDIERDLTLFAEDVSGPPTAHKQSAIAAHKKSGYTVQLKQGILERKSILTFEIDDDIQAGDIVQVVKNGDSRMNQNGTVYNVNERGVMVRFDNDKKVEGFKRASIRKIVPLDLLGRILKKEKGKVLEVYYAPRALVITPFGDNDQDRLVVQRHDGGGIDYGKTFTKYPAVRLQTTPAPIHES